MPPNQDHRRTKVLVLDVPWKDIPKQLKEQAEIGYYTGFHVLQESLSLTLSSLSEELGVASASSDATTGNNNGNDSIPPPAFLDELRKVLMETRDQWQHVTIERLGPHLPQIMECIMDSLYHHNKLESLCVILSPHHLQSFWQATAAKINSSIHSSSSSIHSTNSDKSHDVNNDADADSDAFNPNEWQQRSLRAVFNHMSRVSITTATTASANSVHPSLQQLTLKCRIDDATMECMGQALATTSQASGLKQHGSAEKDANTNIPTSTTNADAPRLAKLSLYGCNLSSIAQLAKGLQQNSTIETLDISYCTLNDQSIATITEAIIDHPTIRHLDISGNYCRDLSMQAFQRCSFHSLNLTNQHPSGHYRYCTKPFRIAPLFACDTTSPRLFSSLQILDLSFNNLNDEDMQELFDGLRDTTLRDLNLMKNSITDAGVVQSIVPNLAKLQKLSLISNRGIGDASAQAFQTALQDNTSLCNLKLPRGLVGMDEIQYYLALNSAGRHIITERKELPLSVWPHVLERSNELLYQSTWLSTVRVDVLYYLLHNSPVLFQK